MRKESYFRGISLETISLQKDYLFEEAKLAHFITVCNLKYILHSKGKKILLTARTVTWQNTNHTALAITF